jgi:ATP:ADP antiporter, AAA family
MQLAATSVLAASGSLAMLGIVMVATRASTHGLTRPARELLFTVVDREDKYHAKNAIDTVGYRLGDLGASWVHKGIAAVSSGAGALVIAAIPLTAIWIGLAITLGIGFRRRHEPR